MRKKLFILAFILMFLLCSIPGDMVRVKASVSAPIVEVTPNVVNEQADYKITFTINQSLPYLGKISVVFPMGTGIPCSSCNPYVAASNLSVNGIVCTQNGVGNTTLRTVDIYSPISLNAGSQVTVFISRNARITTPSAEGSYTLQIYTSSEIDPVTSQPFTIGKSKLTSPKVTLSNNVCSRVSAYTLAFYAGPVYNLSAGVDSINVFFPNGTSLPPTIKGINILVNNVPLSVDFVTTDNDVITMPLPVDISAGASVTLQFTLAAGIQNPAVSGLKTLYISSDKDSTTVESAPYEIIDISNSSTKVIINPPSPDGNNGWYVTLPIVAFIPRLPSDSGAVVYYKIDQGSLIAFSTPFTIPEGTHTISYYTVNTNNEIETAQNCNVKVDATAPQLNISEPADNLKTANNNCTIKGSITDASPTKLLVNGEALNLSSPSFEIPENLKEGLNIFTLICIDEAGNQSSTILNITLSSTVPKISISSPTDMCEIKDNYVNISGTVDSPSTLMINGDNVLINADSSFVYTLSLDNAQKGFVLIKIVATSLESGISSAKTVTVVYNPKPKEIVLKLVINSNIALKDDQSITLDAPPFIDSKTSRTLVPLRFISEAFGADVQWDPLNKAVTVTLNGKVVKLQIGNNQAMVDSQVVNLDQPPVIVDSRTFVPIRFISETFGADVQWDAATKTVTIINQLQ